MHRGSEVLPWQRACEDMVRALFQTASEARGTRADLVTAALGVVFTHFNQADRLSAAVSAVAIVKTRAGSGRSANDPTHSPAMLSQRTQDEVHQQITAPQASLSERSQAMRMITSLRTLERVVTCLKALASTDAAPDASTLLVGMTEAISNLRTLCKARHQRRLQCALGSLSLIHI